MRISCLDNLGLFKVRNRELKCPSVTKLDETGKEVFTYKKKLEKNKASFKNTNVFNSVICPSLSVIDCLRIFTMANMFTLQK